MSLHRLHVAPSLSRRRLLGLTAALAGTTILPRQAWAQGGGSLKFWKMPNSPAEMENAYWAEVTSAFAADAGVPVEHLLLPWGEFVPKYTAAFVSQTAPDISYQVIDSLDQFASQDLFANLLEIDPGLDTSRINKAMLESAMSDGQLFGMPYLSSRFVLALNEDVWEKAGKPDLPTTYDELSEFAKKLTFDQDGRALGEDGFDPSRIATYGMGWPGSYGLQINYIFNYFFSYGVNAFSDDLKDVGFDNEAGRAALTHLRDMQEAGSATPLSLYADSDKWAELLPAGQVGVQWAQANTEIFEKFPDARLMVLEPPAGPAGAFVAGDAGYLCVAASSANKQAALDFIKTVTSGPLFDQYLKQTLLFPVTDDADADAIFGGIEDPRAFKFLADSLTQTKYMLFPQALPYNGNEYLVGEINNYVSGQKTLDQMITDARQQIASMAFNAGL